MGRVTVGVIVFAPFLFAISILTGIYFLYISTRYTGLSSILRLFVGLLFLFLGISLFFPEFSKIISQFIPSFSDWIMQYPNNAGQRAINLGLTLGSIAFSLRVIFGIERGYIR